MTTHKFQLIGSTLISGYLIYILAQSFWLGCLSGLGIGVALFFIDKWSKV